MKASRCRMLRKPDDMGVDASPVWWPQIDPDNENPSF